MSFEQRLRDMLTRKASEASPSRDAWSRITERVDRRPRAVRWAPALVGGVAVVAVAGVALWAGLASDDEEVVVGTEPTEATPPTTAPFVANPACEGRALPSADEDAPDVALREFFDAKFLEGGLAEAPAPELRPDNFTVVGDADRSHVAAVICVRTSWARVTAGADDVSATPVGWSLDEMTLQPDRDGWRVVGWRRGPLQEWHGYRLTPVAFLEPQAVTCGEQDADFTDHVRVGADAGGELVASLQHLLTGWAPPEVEMSHAIPLDARLVSAELDDQGMAYVVVSQAADRGGGSCEMSARREQIRRTALAQPGVRDVEVTVEGKPPEESFQP